MNTFEHCVIKKIQDGWGVFTPTPCNDKNYVWFITRNRKRDNRSFVLIPTWVTDKGSDIDSNILSKSDALKLAQDYDVFYSNAEW
jgi:hypothetical protein